MKNPLLNDNVCGGRGECPHCHEMHGNVAYHSACQCTKRPGYYPPRVEVRLPEPQRMSVDEMKSITGQWVSSKALLPPDYCPDHCGILGIVEKTLTEEDAKDTLGMKAGEKYTTVECVYWNTLAKQWQLNRDWVIVRYWMPIPRKPFSL